MQDVEWQVKCVKCGVMRNVANIWCGVPGM